MATLTSRDTGVDPPGYIPTPSYSPSDNPPSYALDLSPNESRVLYNPRPGFLPSATGGEPVFVNKSKKGDITVSLYTQAVQNIPVYGRNAVIEGSVSVTFKPAQIAAIYVKLQGVATYTIINGHALPGDARHGLVLEHNVLSEELILWARPSGSTSNSTSLPSLPDSLPFAFRLPTKCVLERGSERARSEPLPPTFSAATAPSTARYATAFAEIEPRFQAQVVYHVVVVVEQIKRFGSKSSKLATVFHYIPRSVATHPTLLPPMTFLGTLKTSPEEWSQGKSLIRPRDPSSSFAPLELLLVLPKGYIYPLNLPIPFHIQLQGSRESLIAFLGPPLDPSSSHRPEEATWREDQINIKLSLIRKTGVTLNDRDYASNSEIAVLGPNIQPPLMRDEGSAGADSRFRDVDWGTWRRISSPELLGENRRQLGWEVIAWEGTIIPSPPPSRDTGKTVATFNICDIYVKDFIFITLNPGTQSSSPKAVVDAPFKTHRHVVPICLVTDHFDNNPS